MSAFLEITIDGAPQRVICGNLVTMGRDMASTLQVVDPLVSRLHALIRFVGKDSYYLLDAGSRNGSFINHVRVSTPTLLKSGDVITVGETEVTFIQVKGGDPPEAARTAMNLGETLSHVRLEIQPVTILVADIRGFTTLSERLPITVLSKMMTGWFSNVQKSIEQNLGRVDKFIGDCVMALWYHGPEVEPSAIRACLTAAGQIQQLTWELKDSYPELPERMELAVGINTGMAAVGVGAENTAMGDAVNVAFRLEAACRTLEAQLLLSQSTYQYLPRAVWEGRETDIQVRGKSRAARVCSLRFDELPMLLDKSDWKSVVS